MERGITVLLLLVHKTFDAHDVGHTKVEPQAWMAALACRAAFSCLIGRPPQLLRAHYHRQPVVFLIFIYQLDILNAVEKKLNRG